MLPPRTPIVRIAYEVFSIGCANAKKLHNFRLLEMFRSSLEHYAAPKKSIGSHDEPIWRTVQTVQRRYYTADRAQYGRASDVLHSRNSVPGD